MNYDWTRPRAGFYRLVNESDESLAWVERSGEGEWMWWVDPTIAVNDSSGSGVERTLNEAKQRASDVAQIAYELPNIINNGVQTMMRDESLPVQIRAARSVQWIESWLGTEIALFG